MPAEILSAETLQEVLTQSFEEYICYSVMRFLDGGHSFRWITQVLARSGLSKEDMMKLLKPMRRHADAYRAEALFNWLEKREW